MHKVSTKSADKKYLKVSMKNIALTIPTDTLPKGWRQTGAEKFNVSVSTIEKVVFGMRKNAEIFNYMVDLAEEETKRRDAESQQLAIRLAALTK
jgi:hypothetical protein